jgi:hypothetical protein
MRYEKIVHGLCKLDNPEESCEKSDVVGPWGREAESNASRILTSSFLATISAALPLGARMIGTCPVDRLDSTESLATDGGAYPRSQWH